MSSSPLELALALAYAAKGWPVLALHTPGADGRCSCRRDDCTSIGKHPRTMHGLKDATTDEAKIRYWWEVWPDANVGIVTGAASGLFAVDVDPKNDGDHSLDQLEESYGHVQTLESLTGSGGRHLIFQHQPGLRNTAGALGVGIDTRGEGGYIVAPPSLHPSGRQYRWAEVLWAEVQPAELPNWIPMLMQVARSTGTGPAGLAPAVDGDIADGARNSTLASLAGSMRRRGMDEDEIFAALEVTNSKRCKPPLDEDEVRKIARSVARYEPKSVPRAVASALKAAKASVANDAPAASPGPASSTGSDGGTTLVVNEGGVASVLRFPTQKPKLRKRPEEFELNREAIGALGSHREVYQRAGKLVRITREPPPAPMPPGEEPKRKPKFLRAADTPLIGELPRGVLRSHLTEVANFEKWSKGEGENGDWVPDHPWDWLVQAVHEYGDWPGIRVLEAVVEAPILRPDGTLVTEAGFDARTRVLYVPNCAVPEVPEAPTWDDAREAATLLLDVVVDFPFASDAYRNGWLAALLTCFCRQATGSPSPLFAVDGNIRGSGKSLLADAISIIATGRDMARMVYDPDDAEMRKRITTIVQTGDPLVLIDNIAGPFGGPALDAALTGMHWSDRALGSNQQVRAPLVSSWFATGNNLDLIGDLSRRTLRIRLESAEANPEEREHFKHGDLKAYVRRVRPELIRAALTVLSAYVHAGEPKQDIKPWGSFEGWSDLVRGAIAWLDLADPGTTRVELREAADSEANGLMALVKGWQEVDFEAKGLTASEARQKLYDNPKLYVTLRTAILELCPTRGDDLPSPKSVGKLLQKFLRRPTPDGFCFDGKPYQGTMRWWVGPVSKSEVPHA